MGPYVRVRLIMVQLARGTAVKFEALCRSAAVANAPRIMGHGETRAAVLAQTDIHVLHPTGKLEWG